MAEYLPASEPAPQVTDSPGPTGPTVLKVATGPAVPPVDAPAEKARARILDIARTDSDNAADAAQRERDNAVRTEVVSKAVPERYLQLVEEMRDLSLIHI